MKLYLITLSLLTIILLASCGQDAAHNDTMNHAIHDSTAHAAMQHQDTTVAMAEQVLLKDDRLNAVYRQYVQLTDALINDDLRNARIAGNAIAAGMKDISGGTQVATAAVQITEASNIEALRIAYATLNTALIDKVKQTGLSGGALYVDFCPMALDNKGAYWMTAGKEIRNPYMGAEMLTCGEVKDTITR